MSNYINTTTGEYPVSLARVKKALPNMSFSTAPSEAGSFKKAIRNQTVLELMTS